MLKTWCTLYNEKFKRNFYSVLLSLLGNSSNISIILQMFIAAVEMFCRVYLNYSDSADTSVLYSCSSETAAERKAQPKENTT